MTWAEAHQGCDEGDSLTGSCGDCLSFVPCLSWTKVTQLGWWVSYSGCSDQWTGFLNGFFRLNGPRRKARFSQPRRPRHDRAPYAPSAPMRPHHRGLKLGLPAHLQPDPQKLWLSR